MAGREWEPLNEPKVSKTGTKSSPIPSDCWTADVVDAAGGGGGAAG